VWILFLNKCQWPIGESSPVPYNRGLHQTLSYRDRRGRDRMVVEFTTTYAIGVYHHYSCESESRAWRGVLDTTLCDKVYQ
jgi:hypothetical protein